jgi:hypothetical protein
MSDNVIFFPGYLFVDGFYLHHCKKYRTLHELVDEISFKDYERSLAWDRRRLGVAENDRPVTSGGNAA